MPSKSESERRKVIAGQVRQQSRALHEASRPLAAEELLALFNHLDAILVDGCDHTLRFARAYLAANSLPADTVIPWLAEYGGHCDCEVLANVEEQWPDGRAV